MPFKIVRNDITRVRPFGTAHILKASCIFKLAGERLFQSRFTSPADGTQMKISTGC